jgi:hypothetical protein
MLLLIERSTKKTEGRLCEEDNEGGFDGDTNDSDTAGGNLLNLKLEFNAAEIGEIRTQQIDLKRITVSPHLGVLH